MISRRFEGRLCIRPGCSARPATARLRRACWGAHSRPAVDPSDTALHPFAPVRQGFSLQISIDSFMVRNLTQNRRKIFHLNCVPRQERLQTFCCERVVSANVEQGRRYVRRRQFLFNSYVRCVVLASSSFLITGRVEFHGLCPCVSTLYSYLNYEEYCSISSLVSII